MYKNQPNKVSQHICLQFKEDTNPNITISLYVIEITISKFHLGDNPDLIFIHTQG